MALNLVTEPTPTSPPSAAADWGYLAAKVTAMTQAFSGRNPVDGSTIHAGTLLMIGGALYESTTDTAIGGTPSNFVKITHSGATATADFVASLTGVTWNHVWGQYQDGSGNLYLFDEARAINDGLLAAAYTMQGQIAYLKGGLDINGPLTGATSVSAVSASISGTATASDLVATDDLTVGDDASVGGGLTVTGSSALGGNITRNALKLGFEYFASNPTENAVYDAIQAEFASDGNFMASGLVISGANEYPIIYVSVDKPNDITVVVFRGDTNNVFSYVFANGDTSTPVDSIRILL